MEQIIADRIAAWTRPPFDTATIDEIKKLQAGGDTSELTDRFYRDLEFGTGGLRGVTGAGTNRMNIYTVGMAAQGLADYIVRSGNAAKGIVIARDSRLLSDVFSDESAHVMASNGIKVYLFAEITPTPLASFAIRELGAAAGIVITASHNPPEYNGFKVFWDDGGQIVAPQDDEIIKCVSEISTPDKIKKTDKNELTANGMFVYIDKSIKQSYAGYLSANIAPQNNTDIRIAYTPLHGTGTVYVPDTLRHFGYKNIFVQPEQSIPDGAFPTVASPNPEDPQAMKLVLETAAQNSADIALATDPDADRMGAAVKTKDGYTLLNGNQIGTLLEYYTLTRAAEKNISLESSYIVKTVVTTDLQILIAEHFGCRVFEVLTGFKWIAAKMADCDKKGLKFIFGGEESFGYLAFDNIRDKDAVSSSLLFAEMTAYLKQIGLTPVEWLDVIYKKFGMFLEDSFSITIKGMEGTDKIKAIMSSFRADMPDEINGCDVVRVLDYQNKTSIAMPDRTFSPMKNILPVSDVLQFFLSDGTKISMRPSGTEPKIKFYLSVNSSVGDNEPENVREELQKALKDYTASLKKLISLFY